MKKYTSCGTRMHKETSERGGQSAIDRERIISDPLRGDGFNAFSRLRLRVFSNK